MEAQYPALKKWEGLPRIDLAALVYHRKISFPSFVTLSFKTDVPAFDDQGFKFYTTGMHDINNKLQGFGIAFYENGRIDEGTFKDNKLEGFSRVVHSTGDVSIGDYKAGQKHDKCKCEIPGGSEYIGYYEKD